MAPLAPYLAYYMHLDKPGVITKLQYRFRKQSIVYGIRCLVNEMVYVGSTSEPGLRFDNHLISHTNSNTLLQNDITQFGIDKFVVYIFNVVSYPDGLTKVQRQTHLHKVEQSVIDRFPKTRLYNLKKANKSSPLKINQPL